MHGGKNKITTAKLKSNYWLAVWSVVAPILHQFWAMKPLCSAQIVEIKKERMITSFFSRCGQGMLYFNNDNIIKTVILVLDLCILWYNNTINLIASCGFYGDVNKSLNV